MWDGRVSIVVIMERGSFKGLEVRSLQPDEVGRGNRLSIDGRERLRMVSTNPEEYCPEYEERQ
jgi:hypothetical protein